MEALRSLQHQQPAAASRLGMRNRGGQIMEVQGGHSVRSTGRKDRHSKVCTAKGPRDRRVRLSAHTAIQFYDVQDRLGYDRPSKAVDWLINKAKAAIDELAELPVWKPSSASTTTTTTTARASTNQQQLDPTWNQRDFEFPIQEINGDVGATQLNKNSNFLTQSLDSDSIAYAIKSFFPLEAFAETTSSPIQLQNHHNQHHNLGFSCSSSGWTEHHQNQRTMALNACGVDTGSLDGSCGGVGFFFNPSTAPNLAPQLPLLGQNQFFSQWGTLQSSYSPLIRAWMDPIITDNHPQFTPTIHQESGYLMPARIQGDKEHDGVANKPLSASSESHHW